MPNRAEVFDHTHDGVTRSVEVSLQRLGLARIDILHAQDLDIFNPGKSQPLAGRLAEFMAGSYGALRLLREAGAIAAFGAGVNEWEPAAWLMERGGRIEAVCAAHGVRLVDAAFPFPLRHRAVVPVIPGGQGLAEMEGNLTAAGAAIPEGLWAVLQEAGLLHPEAPV